MMENVLDFIKMKKSSFVRFWSGFAGSFGQNWVQNDRLGLKFIFAGMYVIKKAIGDRKKKKIETPINSRFLNKKAGLLDTHIGATSAKIPPFCAEFRSEFNGICPAAQRLGKKVENIRNV